MDTRNVIDRYKGWTEDLIREDLKTRFFPYAICMAQIVGDFNFGTVVRSANAFGAQDVFYYGKKNWDRRSAVGVHHYTNVKFLSSLDEVKELKNQYTFVALEQNEKSVYLDIFVWPKDKTVLIFVGEEGQGLSSEIIDLCDHVVEIRQFGSVRSLNAGVAAAIVMNDYVTKCLMVPDE